MTKKYLAIFSGMMYSNFRNIAETLQKIETWLESLAHVGPDRVSLGGEGFTGFIKEGDKVKAGKTRIISLPGGRKGLTLAMPR